MGRLVGSLEGLISLGMLDSTGGGFNFLRSDGPGAEDTQSHDRNYLSKRTST
jgi:hypothetical protein